MGVFIGISICLTVILLVADLYQTLRGSPSLLSVCSILVLVLFVSPIVLDHLVGAPSYLRYPGFYDAATNRQVQILYSIALFLTALVFFLFRQYSIVKIPHAQSVREYVATLIPQARRVVWVARLVCIAPIVAVFFAPDISFYSTYAMQYRGHRDAPADVRSFHTYVQLCCHVSILASALNLICARRFAAAIAATLPVWVALAWIVGKRHAVAEIAMILLLAIVVRGRSRPAGIAVAAVSLLVGVLGFSTWYQAYARGVSVTTVGSELYYDDLRVDFFRDDVYKLALLGAFPNSPYCAFDHAGKSFWIYLTLPIPRVVWPEKPLSYGTTVMCIAQGREQSYLGSSMTTSVLDEAISNFGFAGVIFGPLILVWVASRGARKNGLLAHLLTIVVLVLLLVQHLSAWMPIFLVWLLVTAGRHRRSHQRPSKCMTSSPAEHHSSQPWACAYERGVEAESASLKYQDGFFRLFHLTRGPQAATEQG